MSKEYAIYDMKDCEQCVYTGTLKEIAEFLEYSESGLRSYLSHKKAGRRDGLIHKQYELLEVSEEYIDIESENNNKKAFKELIEIFKRPKVEFPIFDEFKWELKRRKDMIVVGEEWQKIRNSNYSISNYGRIRNDITGILKTPKINKGLVQINLCNKGQSKTFAIARLVANYFIREIQINERVRHIDEDFRNNYYKNLEIVSK